MRWVYIKKISHYFIFFLPIVFVLIFSLISHSQLIQPTVQNGVIHFETDNPKAIFQLHNGWTFYEENSARPVPIQSFPAKMTTTKNGTFVLKLHAPAKEQLYSLCLKGLNTPFEVLINNQKITPNTSNTAHFYIGGDEEITEIQLKIKNNSQQIQLLDPPLFGQLDAIQTFQLRKYLFTFSTAFTLTLLGLYCIVLYFSKKSKFLQFHVGVYFLLFSMATLFSGENIGQFLFGVIALGPLTKLKTILGLRFTENSTMSSIKSY